MICLILTIFAHLTFCALSIASMASGMAGKKPRPGGGSRFLYGDRQTYFFCFMVASYMMGVPIMMEA